MTDQERNGHVEQAGRTREKRRVMLTQLLRSPVLNPAGSEVGRVEDFIVKLAEGGGYPPITGLKVRVGAQDVFVGIDLVDKLEPGAVRLNTHTIQTQPFQRRPGQVLLASDVLGRPPADAELTADICEELDSEHQAEFIKSRSNEEAARVLDKMAPDDAADLLGELDQERRLPVLNLMSPNQQHKMRKLLQYHPTTAGGMMSPDYVWVVRGSTADMAVEAARVDDKSPHQLLNTVFVTEEDGKFVGSIGLADLVRADRSKKVEELALTNCTIGAGADFADVTLMMADYNLTPLPVPHNPATPTTPTSRDPLLH